ncbi:MAG: metal ABC transporter ATP-binding protein [Actinomycetota bacterium]|nr:metal ABC transporter ATP-binding protein [Actinomycetota bacterium]
MRSLARRPLSPAESSGPLVVAEGVSFAYSGTPALEAVDLTVHRGQFVALVGPNGSGKSTLVRILLGLSHPVTGSVRLFGADPRVLRDRWRVGYVPQRLNVDADLPATVGEVVAAGRLSRTGWLGRFRAADREAVDRALEAVALPELRRARLGELSGGQQQRVFIAKALAGEPELLVLDEPVAGVDADSQRRFRDSLMSLLRDRRGAVLLVSHELASVADDLDRVVVLKRRVMFEGPPADLVAGGVSLGVHREDLPVWLEGLGP